MKTMKQAIAVVAIFGLLTGAVSAYAAESATAVDAAKAATTPLDPVAAAALLKQQPYDHVLGNEKAPVTIVEYSSLSCPHCADFHDQNPAGDREEICGFRSGAVPGAPFPP